MFYRIFLCQHPFPIHISECSFQHYIEQATFWQLIYISRTMLSSHRFERRHLSCKSEEKGTPPLIPVNYLPAFNIRSLHSFPLAIFCWLFLLLIGIFITEGERERVWHSASLLDYSMTLPQQMTAASLLHVSQRIFSFPFGLDYSIRSFVLCVLFALFVLFLLFLQMEGIKWKRITENEWKRKFLPKKWC